jgi:hypothetical protein
MIWEFSAPFHSSNSDGANIAMASLRSDFDEIGLVNLDDFGSSQMWASLSAEAAECEPEAGPRLYRGLAVKRDGSVLSHIPPS